MDEFTMNGIRWKIRFVKPNDRMLVDRTNTLTVATTDPNSHTVYLSLALKGDFLMTVFLHELGHCAMISYNLAERLHSMVKPECWIEAEEWVCNFLADYGKIIYSIAYSKFGYKAWVYVPAELEKIIA